MKYLIILIGLANAVYALSDEQVVALTLLGEARGEGNTGMYAVACVIKQRSANRRLTLRQVCLQRKQFSCWNGKGVSTRLLRSPSAAYATRIARHLVGGGNLELGYVKNADHYCTLRTNPYWARGEETVAVIGNHKFYKLK